jgi:hypothetical protein
MRTRARVHNRRRGAVLVVVVWALAALALPSFAPAFTWAPNVQPTGPSETIFDWSTQRCQSNNIPDAPAHAIRDARNRIQIYVSHWVNYRLTGRTFNSLTYDCHTLMASGESGDPSTFNNKEWLGSFYTEDGRRIYALVSNEFQGTLFVGFCTSGNYFKCLYTSISGAVSYDYGDDYTNLPNPLVRASAYQYFNDSGPYGVNVPSNIVKAKDGYYYALYHAEDYLAQVPGACLMRTRNLRDTTSWRSWTGSSFSLARKNPYVVVPMERAEPYICTPVDFASIELMSQSLTWNTYFHKWLLVGNAGKYDPDRNENVYGMYYSTSSDLIHWSDRKLLVEVPLPHTWVCGQEFPWGFPSVIDHDSHSRNFDTSDRTFYLYYTLNNRANCVSGLDRDLVRVPIKFLSP